MARREFVLVRIWNDIVGDIRDELGKEVKRVKGSVKRGLKTHENNRNMEADALALAQACINRIYNYEIMGIYHYDEYELEKLRGRKKFRDVHEAKEYFVEWIRNRV